MNLDQIRKKLNIIDAQIVHLIAKRQSYMPSVGKYKKQNNLPLYQPKRELAIIAVQKKLGKKLGLDTSLIQKIFLSIFKNSREIQKKSQK